MGRVTFSGPVKSPAGFEVGSGRSDGTNTTVINSDGILVTGNKAPVTASITASATLTASQSGTVFLVGTDTATVTLPATVAGVMYTFIVNDTTDPVTITPDSSDMIQGKVVLGTSTTTLAFAGEDANSIGMTTTNVTVGDNVSIIGDGGAGWLLLGGRGLGLSEIT